jgi:hypothetical protein
VGEEREGAGDGREGGWRKEGEMTQILCAYMNKRKKIIMLLGVVVHTCNHSPRETEALGSGVQDQSGLHCRRQLL